MRENFNSFEPIEPDGEVKAEQSNMDGNFALGNTQNLNDIEKKSGENMLPDKKETRPVFERKVKEFARDFFEEIYSSEGMNYDLEADFSSAFNDIRNKLSDLSNSEAEGVCSKYYKESAKIFLEELIFFSNKKGREDNEKADKFLEKINEMFFGFSPNIITELNLEQQFDFAAEATRTNNLQARIGDGIIRELTENIAYGYGYDEIKESYSKSSVSEKLDKLNLMERIAASFIESTYSIERGRYYAAGYERMEQILEEIGDDNRNAFVGYYINLVKDRIEKEREIPSMGAIPISNNPGNARLWEQPTAEQLKESDELKKEIALKKPLKRGEKLVQIADGTVAILNHANVPIKYARVNLANIREENSKVGADFVDFDEFMDSNGNYIKDDEVKRGELLFQHLYRPAMREKIESEFGIKLKELPFHYHVHFLKFLSEKNIDEAENVKEFLNQAQSDEARINRIKSFLSLGAGEEMRDSIFGIGESLEDQKTADAIFAKYAEIVDATDDIKSKLGELLKDQKGVSLETVGSTSRSMIDKANGLLLQISSDIENARQTGQKIDSQRILTDLENFNTGLLLTAGIYKSLKDSIIDIRPEDLEGVAFHRVTARQLRESPEMIVQMIDMYRRNYKEKDALRKQLLDGLENQIQYGGDDVTFFIYEKNGMVMAFNRFDDNGADGFYFASFNVRKDVAGLCLGDALAKASLSQITAQGRKVKGDSLAEKDIGSYYIGRAGFIAKSFARDYQGTKEQAFGIELNADNQNYHYREKGFDAEKIFTEYKEKFAGKEIADGFKEYLNNGQSFVLKFKRDSEEFFGATEKILGDKNTPYVLTRYIFRGGDVYCAFEPERGGK